MTKHSCRSQLSQKYYLLNEIYRLDSVDARISTLIVLEIQINSKSQDDKLGHTKNQPNVKLRNQQGSLISIQQKTFHLSYLSPQKIDEAEQFLQSYQCANQSLRIWVIDEISHFIDGQKRSNAIVLMGYNQEYLFGYLQALYRFGSVDENQQSQARFILLILQMQKYDILGIIGEGAYGVVLKCRCNDNKEIVAIKKFKESEEDEVVKKTTMREVKVLKMLHHPNIVELKEAFRKKGIVYLVFEYVQNNLLEVLQKSQDGIGPETIRLLIYQLLKGLAYMHSLNMLHRDIKPQNLLISDKKQLKICDFGFARTMRKGPEEELTDYVATRWYRPPQLLVGASYGKEIDIWAVGCILGEIIDGNPMFPGENELDQLFLIQKCLGPLTPDHYETFLKNQRFLGMKFPEIHTLDSIDKRYLGKASPRAINFMKQLLKMNPAERLSAIDALKHPYFDGIREQDFLRKLSSNNYIKNQGKIQGVTTRQDEPKTVTQDRKKYSNIYNPPTNSREHTEELVGTNEFNRSTKININRKGKEELNKMLTSKGFNGGVHSKSVNKSHKPTQKQIKEKNISLEKHQNRELITKTQTGFYILAKGAIAEREEQHQTMNSSTHYNRNKIYNAEQPKSRNNQRTRNVPTNTQQIAEEDEIWQSTGQLPLIMVGSQQNPQSRAEKQRAPTNIVITNSTFNYRTNH